MSAKPAQDRDVPVAGGELAVRDHGGDGLGILLVHPPAFSLEMWSGLAAELVPHVHPVSWDLRGHARSSAPIGSMAEFSGDVLAVAEASGLTRPLVVVQDLSAVHVVAAVAAAPEQFSGLALIDSPSLGPAAAIVEALSVLDDPEVWAEVSARSHFGLRTTPAELDSTVDELTAIFARDWLVGGHRADLLRAGARRGFRREEDGTFLRRPTSEQMRTLVAVGRDGAAHGAREVVDTLPLPVWAIQPEDGTYADVATSIGDSPAAGPRLLWEVPGGPYAATTHPREVAEAILQFARTIEH